MAITAGIPVNWRAEVLQGIHDIGDTYMIALYTGSATIGPSSTTYTTTGEVAAGGGYTAGGKVLTGAAVTVDAGTAILSFDDPSWANATITARGAMIYNASKGNKAVAVLDFGANITSTNGTFLVDLPAATATAGLLRIA